MRQTASPTVIRLNPIVSFLENARTDHIRDCDVAVIGAGAIGVSVAYELAKAGRSVTVSSGRMSAPVLLMAMPGGFFLTMVHPSLDQARSARPFDGSQIQRDHST